MADDFRWWGYSGLGGFDTPTPTPAAGTYFTLEIHWRRNEYYEGWVDDNYLGKFEELFATMVGIYVGLWGGIDITIDANAVAYIDEVKAGTTRGGSDLFADSFESADLSAWTDSYGLVSVVDNPYGSGKVLRAETSDPDIYDAYAFKVIAGGLEGGAVDDLYLTLKVAFDAAALALWQGDNNVSGDFGLVNGSSNAGIYLANFPTGSFPEPPGISYAFGHGAHESPRDWTRVDDPGQPSESGP